MLTISPSVTKFAAVAAAIAVAVGAGIAINATDYDQRANAALSDAGESRLVGSNRLTDLLTETVPPGASTDTTVNLPCGSVPVSVMPAIGFSETHSVAIINQDDAGGCVVSVVVHATNNGSQAERFTGFVEFSAP